MNGADQMLDSHRQKEALRAARIETGDRKRTIDLLTAMAARDPLLAEALFRLGVRTAAANACTEYKSLVKTGGNFLAAHPEDEDADNGE